MRLFGMFNVVAVVIAVGVGCVGVSGASANSEHILLCEKAELECQKPFASPQTVVGHAVSPKLLSSVGTVECEKSLAELSLLTESGESTLGHLLALSFEGNCSLGSTACTITTEALGSISFSKVGALEASSKPTGTQVKVKCGSFINCTYGAGPETSLVAKSDSKGSLSLSAEAKTVSGKGFLCPSTSKLDATYTTLGSMWIESPSNQVEEKEIILCEQPELECEKPFENATTVVGHAEAPKLLSSAGTVECEKSLAELSVLNEAGESLIGHLLALSFEGNCHLGGTSCSVTTESLGLILFTKTGPLKASAKPTGGTQVRVKCGALIDCKYASEPLLTAISSEAGETQLIANEAALTGGKGTNCPKTAELDAAYTALGAMWIESPPPPKVENELVLCEQPELECGSPFPDPTLIVAHATSPKLLSNAGTVECEKSLAELSLLNANSESIVGHLLSLSFEGNCHLGGTACTVTVNALGGISIARGEEKLTAIVKAVEREGNNTNATVKCGPFINCTYSAGPETELEAKSDAEGNLSLEAEAKTLSGKGFLCPSTSKLDVTYTALGSMWIAVSRVPGCRMIPRSFSVKNPDHYAKGSSPIQRPSLDMPKAPCY